MALARGEGSQGREKRSATTSWGEQCLPWVFKNENWVVGMEVLPGEKRADSKGGAQGQGSEAGRSEQRAFWSCLSCGSQQDEKQGWGQAATTGRTPR